VAAVAEAAADMAAAAEAAAVVADMAAAEVAAAAEVVVITKIIKIFDIRFLNPFHVFVKRIFFANFHRYCFLPQSH